MLLTCNHVYIFVSSIDAGIHAFKEHPRPAILVGWRVNFISLRWMRWVSSYYIEKLSLASYFSSRFVGNEIPVIVIIQYSSLIKREEKEKRRSHIRTSSTFFFFFSFLHILYLLYLTMFITFSFISLLLALLDLKFFIRPIFHSYGERFRKINSED